MDDHIKLEQSGLFAKPGELFEVVKKSYARQLDTISKHLNEKLGLKEKVKEHAKAAAVADWPWLIKRHQSEWQKSMRLAVRAADSELDKYDDMLEQLPRAEDVPDFRKRFVQSANKRRQKIVRARGMADRLIMDLEAHSGEK